MMCLQLKSEHRGRWLMRFLPRTAGPWRSPGRLSPTTWSTSATTLASTCGTKGTELGAAERLEASPAAPLLGCKKCNCSRAFS